MIASSAHTPHSDSRLEVIPRGEDAAEIVERSRVVHDRDALNLVAKIGQASAQITEGEAAAREQRGLYSCPSCSFAKGAGVPSLLELLQVLIIDFHCF